MKIVSCILCIFFHLFACSFLYADSRVQVHDVWVLEAPPGINIMAAYLMIKNQSTRDLVLRKVSSPSFQRVEMHRTEIDNEQARMVQQSSMHIPAGDTLTFVPGGQHLMLIGPDRHFRSGDEITLDLSFDNGGRISVNATVRKYVKHDNNHGIH